MDLVIDANVIFASLIKDGLTAELLFVEELHLCAPEYLLDEMDKYRDLLQRKTERTDEEFKEFLRVMKRRISFIPKEELEGWLQEAKRTSPDRDDAPYLALAIKKGIGIWSNDGLLKGQSMVPVYSTGELLAMLKCGLP
ncbi:MAG: hypothetical protein FJ149_11555 [Euryarchaeota archaeon]|nr:hypothetical protein [Euryarchaeota archaeon]